MQCSGALRPPLPPFRPPALPAVWTGAVAYSNVNEDSHFNESQPPLSPPPPLPVVTNNGRRVVESQLTAATGLGNDFVSSPGSSEEEEESGVRASTEQVPRA